MMNDRRAWDKRKAAQFADPKNREQAIRNMRRYTGRQFNIKGEQPSMEDYRATVGFAAGSWQDTTGPRNPVMVQQEETITPIISRKGISRTLAGVLVFACLVAMGFVWLDMQQQIQTLSTANGERSREIALKQEENQEIQTQITLATREQPIRERARNMGMRQEKDSDVVELNAPGNLLQINAEKITLLKTTDTANQSLYP